MTLPNFLLVGAEKAGTTWMRNALDLHPNCFLSPTKEIHFFNKYGPNLQELETYESQSLEWYSRFFEDAGPEHLAIGEATPLYLSDPLAPERIKETLANVKLIAVVRDPIDRAMSHYQMLSHKYDFDQSFLHCIEQQDQRIIGRGRYVEFLRTYVRLFDRESLLVLNFDEVVNQSGETFREIFEFLDLDPGLMKYKGIYEVDRNSVARHRFRLVEQLGVSLASQLWQNRITWPIAKFLKQSGFYAMIKRLNRVPTSKIEASQVELDLLREIYTPLNDALSSEFGVDVSAWR